MPAYNLYATKDNAEGQLNASISASDTSIPLKSGEGAEFPTTYNGSATSVGTATVLNSTGIGASGVSVGDVIENLTDLSTAIIKTVSTNSVTTTALVGGSDNTWQNSDEWAVNTFIVTLNKRSDGVITTSEKVKIKQRSGDTLTTATSGRGFDGSSATSFSADDYVNLFATSTHAEGVSNAIKQAMLELSNKAESSDVTDLNNTIIGLLNARNWKNSVIAATTANITLSTDVENGDTLDGITLSTGDRILVKDQSTASENGVYTVAASGAPTRATDFDGTSEITAAVVGVEQGTTNADTVWFCTSDDPVVDTDNIVFVSFGTKNISDADANTLTNGGDASLLHTHDDWDFISSDLGVATGATSTIPAGANRAIINYSYDSGDTKGQFTIFSSGITSANSQRTFGTPSTIGLSCSWSTPNITVAGINTSGTVDIYYFK